MTIGESALPGTPASSAEPPPGRGSLDSAVAQMRAQLTPIDTTETVALAEAPGRVSAAAVFAQVDVPAFDSSAMDGYALRACDLDAQLQAVGRSYAGHGFAGEVAAGTCVRIMTGAPLPSGADTVVMLEDVEVVDHRVRVLRRPVPGANIRRRGAQLHRGDRVLPAGRWLGPAEIGLAAAAGAARVAVRRRLRIGVASTGDELSDAPQPLAAAGSYDGNRPLLVAAAQRLGFGVEDLGICRDDGLAFETLLAYAFALELDALVVSGGTAQGDTDIVRRAGGVGFVPLDMRPGRGLAFARLQRSDRQLALFGLPGNAVPAFIMFHLAVRPALLHLAGAEPTPLLRLQLPLAHDTSGRSDATEYRRARIVRAEGRPAVELLAEQDPAMLRTVVEADALAVIAASGDLAAGTSVEVIPLAVLV